MFPALCKSELKKRTQRPKQPEKLNVAEEREKQSVKTQHNRSDSSRKSPRSKRDVTNQPTTTDTSMAREKSPIKHRQQRWAAAGKAAVAAEASAWPTKRPALTPVQSTGSRTVKAGARTSLGGSPPESSVASQRLQQSQPNRGVEVDAQATKATEAKPRNNPTWLSNSRYLDNDAAGDSDVGDDDNDDAPARAISTSFSRRGGVRICASVSSSRSSTSDR